MRGRAPSTESKRPPAPSAGTYGNDAAKLRSVAALDLLALNNPAALTAITQADGKPFLQGLQRHGGEQLREATGQLLRGVSSPDTLTVAVDTASHARQAHETRLKHSKVWQSAVGGGVQRARAPTQDPADQA